MVFTVFENLDMTSPGVNTISFNGYDSVFFTIGSTYTFTGAGCKLRFYAKNENQEVLIKEFTNAELQTSSNALSFRGCPNEIKVEYSIDGTVLSGSLTIKANVI